MTKILIIEDDHSVRTGLIDLLEENNYLVYSAATGKEGIVLARQLQPDLIICDILMPGADGYEVINTLNEDSSTSTIPFIFLTAKSEMHELRKGMGLGAADYIVKPYDAIELLTAINIRINKHKELLNRFDEAETKKTNKYLENDNIILLINNKPSFIKINLISVICAENVYTEISLNDGTKSLVRKSLREWEEILPDNIFLRIHRSTIINTNHIQKIEKWSNRSFMVYMKYSNKPFLVSQRYALKLKSIIIR